MGAIKAYDADEAKEWKKGADNLGTLVQAISGLLQTSGDQRAMAVGLVIVLVDMGITGPISGDDDDDLATLEVSIPADGPTIEPNRWTFSRRRGPSTWSYAVDYVITRRP